MHFFKRFLITVLVAFARALVAQTNIALQRFEDSAWSYTASLSI